MGIEGEGQLWKVCLYEGYHSTVLYADDMRGIFFTDIVRTVSETNCGCSGLHLDIILDRNGYSKQWREMFVRIPLFLKGKIIFSCFETFAITLLSLIQCELEVIFSDDA